MGRQIDLDLTPSELKAIEEHKYFMSMKVGHEVKIEEAIEDFCNNVKNSWVRDKQLKENQTQLQEILRYKELRSHELGYHIDDVAALREWSEHHASSWRIKKESLEGNGFEQISVVVQLEKGLHVRPSSNLTSLCYQYDADIYVHKEGMREFSFILEGKMYINVKSVTHLLGLAACRGERLDFIAIGREAKAALQEIAGFLNQAHYS
ncbi:MAG: HPr family phosphocarrier protein [Spirochaetales bacterium]|nr:HPr family phosphocarrier protein [Spirochaetales bacterium]